MKEEECTDDGPDEAYNEEWSSLTLEQAIIELLRPEEASVSEDLGGKAMTKLTMRGFRISEILQRLEPHPELISRPSRRAGMTRIRRAINNTESILKIGNRRSSSYFHDPRRNLEEADMKAATNLVIRLLMRSGGTISRDSMAEATKNDRWRGFQDEIVVRLEEEGIVEKLDGGNIRCTGEAWTHDALVKRNSTFTLTSRTEFLLSELAKSLSKHSANIPGFDMRAPQGVSKSGVIDIAVACLKRAIQDVGTED